MKKDNYGGVEEDLSAGAILSFFIVTILFLVGVTYILSLG
jgi:hypothetical protein